MNTSTSPVIQRLGQILVDEGLLEPANVQTLLSAQGERKRPIGLLAEELFGLDPAAIERAWARQYTQGAERVDPMGQRVQSRALEAIERRQAWQFSLLPLRFDGADLVAATTEGNVVRALRFTLRCLSTPCYLMLAEPQRLREALAYYYPMAGLGASGPEGGSLPSSPFLIRPA